MSPYLILGVPLFAVFWNLYWLLLRPERKRRKAALAVPAAAAPEMREPRDTSRPYPRPKGSRSKLNRVCPVCGTGAETGGLDGRVLGWPAHRTCAEWAGDWMPPSPEIKELQRALDDFKDHQVPVAPPARSGGGKCWCNYCRGRAGVHGEEAVALYRAETAAQINAVRNKSPRPAGQGTVRWTGNEVGLAYLSPEAGDLQALLANGIITYDEFRERLDKDILGAFSVPPPDLGQSSSPDA